MKAACMNESTIPIKKRINAIDQLRGIIMIIMALDHVRDFFHNTAMIADPTDPATTTPILFFTRWITHFCAPLFVLLTGAGAYLYGQNKTKKQLSWYLFTRGLWLVILELTLITFLFTFDPFFHQTILQVIWVTGISMIILSVLIYLPLNYILSLGLLIIVSHNLLDAHNFKSNNDIPVWWGMIHQQFVDVVSKRFTIYFFYPLFPWPGLMMVGYCLGTLYSKSFLPDRRKKILGSTGWILLAAFFLFRFSNIYGDLVPWATQNNSTATIISFFNVTKYPPSLLYLCMTIGAGLLVLAWLENRKGAWLNSVIIFGRVPLFYYVLHFFVIHAACTINFFINGHTISQAGGTLFAFRPNDFGYDLWIVYLIWIVLVIGIYPLCKKYSRYKASHNYWWLSYV